MWPLSGPHLRPQGDGGPSSLVPRWESSQQPPVGSLEPRSPGLGPAAGCQGRSGLHTWPPAPSRDKGDKGRMRKGWREDMGPDRRERPAFPQRARLAPAGQGALAITRCLSILTTYQDTTSITWKLLGPPTRSRLPSPPPPRSESCQVELPGPPLGITPISTLPASNAQTASTCAHDTTWAMFLPSTPTQSQHKRPFPGALRILHTHI